MYSTGPKKHEKVKCSYAIDFKTGDSKKSSNADVKEKATENKRIIKKVKNTDINFFGALGRKTHIAYQL